MTQTSHTPGPWKSFYGKCVVYYDAAIKFPVEIATVNLTGVDTGDAAPELLEALQELLLFANQYGIEKGSMVGKAAQGSVQQLVETAIAKAMGQ